VAVCTIVDDDGSLGVGDSDIPATSFLGGGMPNPFRDRATIEWGLSTPANVDLSVFDVQGRWMRRLASGNVPAGRRRVTWDGLDEAGHRAPSGLYVIRLRLGGNVYRSTLLRIQ
jgi:flagellar hook capping protein FlgD